MSQFLLNIVILFVIFFQNGGQRRRKAAQHNQSQPRYYQLQLFMFHIILDKYIDSTSSLALSNEYSHVVHKSGFTSDTRNYTFKN